MTHLPVIHSWKWNASQKQCLLSYALKRKIATLGFKHCFSVLVDGKPFKHRLLLHVKAINGPSNIISFHGPLSAALQAILQPWAKSSSKESLTRALRPTQSGTIWHLPHIAFVTCTRICLPVRHLCLSWVLVPQPLVLHCIGNVSAWLLGMSAAFISTTMSSKTCWHHLPGTTVYHLALWHLPSLSKSC